MVNLHTYLEGLLSIDDDDINDVSDDITLINNEFNRLREEQPWAIHSKNMQVIQCAKYKDGIILYDGDPEGKITKTKYKFIVVFSQYVETLVGFGYKKIYIPEKLVLCDANFKGINFVLGHWLSGNIEAIGNNKIVNCTFSSEPFEIPEYNIRHYEHHYPVFSLQETSRAAKVEIKGCTFNNIFEFFDRADNIDLKLSNNKYNGNSFAGAAVIDKFSMGLSADFKKALAEARKGKDFSWFYDKYIGGTVGSNTKNNLVRLISRIKPYTQSSKQMLYRPIKNTLTDTPQAQCGKGWCILQQVNSKGEIKSLL